MMWICIHPSYIYIYIIVVRYISILVLFIVDGYGIREFSWCSPKQKQVFPTLSDAKRQCSDDPSCTMFYDRVSAGNKFYLCNHGAEIKSSALGSLLYIKRSE